MDAIKLLRTQVAAKIAYLESDQAAEDATKGLGRGTEQAQAYMLCFNKVRADAFREILNDINALNPTKQAAA